MSIVSSIYTIEHHAQIDGRKYVTEIHTDSENKEYIVTYLAEIGADCDAIMQSRVDTINLALAEQEAQEILNG